MLTSASNVCVNFVFVRWFYIKYFCKWMNLVTPIKLLNLVERILFILISRSKSNQNLTENAPHISTISTSVHHSFCGFSTLSENGIYFICEGTPAHPRSLALRIFVRFAHYRQAGSKSKLIRISVILDMLYPSTFIFLKKRWKQKGDYRNIYSLFNLSFPHTCTFGVLFTCL